jgi:hypothetical protein
MTIDVSAQVDTAERASLPPPLAFGEMNTLTLPRGRRAGASRGAVAQVVEPAGSAPRAGGLRTSVVAADSTSLTLTF